MSTNKRQRSIDVVWDKIFSHYNILEVIKTSGIFNISADMIRKFKEPRLVVKFDHYNQQPAIFKENNITILPDTRGTYILGEFNVYQKVSYDPEIKPIHKNIPKNIETIRINDITSESAALHAAYLSGMIDDFIGEKTLQTTSGRMSSTKFSFLIEDYKENTLIFNINNSQIEIDGGYESENFFMIIEAKNHRVDNFHIRQVYYPYRLFRGKSISKSIKNIFFTYSNDIFSFFEYEFKDDNLYNSLRLLRQEHYILTESSISQNEILSLLGEIKLTNESSEIPFPQADNFERVIDLCMVLLEDIHITKDDLATNYDFVPRQSDYYMNAARYLGYVQITKNEGITKLSLTVNGEQVMKLNTKEKFMAIAENILSHEPFKFVLEKHFIKSPNNFEKLCFSQSEIATMLQSLNLNYNDTTLNRRASSVRNWLNWILKLPKII